MNKWTLLTVFAVLIGAIALASVSGQSDRTLLLQPDNPEVNQRAPDVTHVRLETTKGIIRLEMRRAWAPHGVDRFYNLVRHGYYDNAAVFRVLAGRWAQFGINDDPKVAQLWRTRTIPDDPRVESNVRGTVAFAFKDPNGRTTQVFINLRDNSVTHDAEPFVPIAKVIEGMDVADALYSEYGEQAGGGIRAGKQDPVFVGGNQYLKRNFPRLDYIVKATIEREPWVCVGPGVARFLTPCVMFNRIKFIRSYAKPIRLANKRDMFFWEALKNLDEEFALSPRSAAIA